jgi:hypothetical protein
MQLLARSICPAKMAHYLEARVLKLRGVSTTRTPRTKNHGINNHESPSAGFARATHPASTQLKKK